MKDWLNDSKVALIKEEPVYATDPPFDASEAYPEWPGNRLSRADNPAYRGLRKLFRALEYDDEHYGTAAWNPLGGIVNPDDTVIIKPNFVSHRNHGERAFGLTDTDSLITHGSILRAVLDYTAKALVGRGRIIIADCPVQGARWDAIVKLAGLEEIGLHCRRIFPGVEVKVTDYRLARAETLHGWVSRRVVEERHLAEYRELDLKRRSLLLPLMEGRKYEFGVSQYPRWRMRAAHTPSTNRYIIPEQLLSADVMINLPKMKAHQKAGITCSLKNVVGVNGHKDYLPHFRYGSAEASGDEYPRGNVLWNLMWACAHRDWDREGGFAKMLFRAGSYSAQKLLRLTGMPSHYHWVGAGSWHGNDTLWRTVLDVNRAFFYFDRHSQSVGTAPRTDMKYLAILDGIVGGDRESPLAPSPVKCGWMMAGRNPVALDSVATACMAFDLQKVPQIREAYLLSELPLAAFQAADIEIAGNTGATNIRDIYSAKMFTPFEPSRGFKGHLEHDVSAEAAATWRHANPLAVSK